MKITIVTKQIYYPSFPNSESGIEITAEQYAGLRAGTHKIGDALKALWRKRRQRNAGAAGGAGEFRAFQQNP